VRPFRALGITLFNLSPVRAVCREGVQPFE
jgi:hypothetical protein